MGAGWQFSKGVTWHLDEEGAREDCHGEAGNELDNPVQKDQRDRKGRKQDAVLTVSGGAETGEEGEAGDTAETLREAARQPGHPSPRTQPQCRAQVGGLSHSMGVHVHIMHTAHTHTCAHRGHMCPHLQVCMPTHVCREDIHTCAHTYTMHIAHTCAARMGTRALPV